MLLWIKRMKRTTIVWEIAVLEMQSLRKGRLVLNSEFVENLQDNSMPNGDNILRAHHVNHSIKNTTPLKVCVVIDEASGSVRRCTCTCIVSTQGHCVHVTVVILHLSDFVKANDCVVDCPSTPEPCEWNKKGEK